MPSRFSRCSFFLTSLLLVSTATSAAPANRGAIANNYGKLPIAFEANRGQTDERVKFIARGSAYGLFLTGHEAVLALHTAGTDVIRMQLSGANPLAHPSGIDRLPGTANYFIGSDSSKWHTAIPTYSKAKFSSVYPGVDVVYYGNQSQLEFDLVVAPQADPKAIQLHFAGARNLKLTAEGDLSVSARKGHLAFHKPLVYQETNGRREPVEGRFILEANNSVGFALGRYNRSQPLIIDPVLAFATYLGGAKVSYYDGDRAYAIAVDSSGDAYVTGHASSTDFPLTAGAFQTTNKGQPSNAFVTKINPTGTTLIYSTYLGGSTFDEALGIAVDRFGDAYVTGETSSADFPVTPGAFQTTNKSKGGNAFISKLDSNGTELLYSTFLGGSGIGFTTAVDYANAVAVDTLGSAYVVGVTASHDFPVTPGAFQTSNNAPTTDTSVGFNAFVTKLDPTGTSLVYSTYLGGSGVDMANAIALDMFGNAYVAGANRSTDFPVTAGAFQTTFRQSFVTKFNPTGTALLYSTYLGGSSLPGRPRADTANAIAVDDSGNAFVAGEAASTDFPVTPGAFQTTNRSPYGLQSNAFVTKLDSNGAALLYSTLLGPATARTLGRSYIQLQ